MFTLFLRAILLYVVMILTLRGLGKRQLGEFQPYEFALTILIANVISAPIESVATPLLYGFLPVAAMFVVHGLLTLLCLKSDRIRAVVSGKPTVVISRGVINRRELERLCLSLSDLLEGLRTAGCLDPAEVGTAVIEANGMITAFADSAKRPVQTGEMKLSPGYEGLPLALIMDGRVQSNNLKQSRQTQAWLTELLAQRGLGVKAVYLASLDTQGKLLLQLCDGRVMQFQALPPEKAVW